MLEIAAWLAVAFAVLVGAVALSARNASRTWSDEDYERARRGGTSLGNAMLATQAFLQPGAQHALEQRTSDEADDAESGDPPEPGAAGA